MGQKQQNLCFISIDKGTLLSAFIYTCKADIQSTDNTCDIYKNENSHFNILNKKRLKLHLNVVKIVF